MATSCMEYFAFIEPRTNNNEAKCLKIHRSFIEN